MIVGCRPAGAETTLSGEQLYAECQACHGENAEGIQLYHAPAIAGLPAWYLDEQLRKFRGSHRAYHPDDATGLRMRPMARGIRNERELDALVEYISGLPPQPAAPTLQGGDANAGKAAFGVCIACHGPTGLGNEALKAPPLVGQHDWYLVNQLQKFRAGHRGTAPGDTTGATMRPMAMTLTDDQAVKNVVAYISTLSAPTAAAAAK